MQDEIYQVPPDIMSEMETLGTKTKYWFRDPDTGVKVLFKQGRPGTGENWSEVVCSRLCELLGIPAAKYEFAVWGGNQGVITETFIQPGSQLIIANELFGLIDTNYDQTERYKPTQHSVERISISLNHHNISSPVGYDLPFCTAGATDVFAGYLMLDALAGNTDRHHENWGLLITSKKEVKLSLAPSYDHAASLGRNESDKRRLKRLESSDSGFNVAGYARRARSAIYGQSEDRILTTYEAFSRMASNQGIYRDPRAPAKWLKRLDVVNRESIASIFSKIPNHLISEVAIRFATELILENKKQLISNNQELL